MKIDVNELIRILRLPTARLFAELRSALMLYVESIMCYGIGAKGYLVW